MVHRIYPTVFSGHSQLYDRDRGLSRVVQGLAIDNARLRLQVSDIKDITDGSTGTAKAALQDVPLPVTKAPAADAGNAAVASVNTALTSFHNAYGILAGAINQARTTLGLSPLAVPGAAAGTAGTIAAVTKTVSTGTGTSAAGFASTKRAIDHSKDNLRRLAIGVEEVVYAVGGQPIPSALSGSFPATGDLTALAAGAATVGGLAATKAEVDAALTALANDVATLAAKWNDAMTQGTSAQPLSVIAAPRA